MMFHIQQYHNNVAVQNEVDRLKLNEARRRYLQSIDCGHNFNSWDRVCVCGISLCKYYNDVYPNAGIDDICPLSKVLTNATQATPTNPVPAATNSYNPTSEQKRDNPS